MEDIRLKVLEFLGVEEIIKEPEIRSFTVDGLLYASEDFFIIPASSSGKYHPEYALGPMGLVRHTRACIVIAEELFPLYNFSDYHKDLIISALTLHDIEKPSRTHPIEVKLRLEVLREGYPDIFDKVIPLIESHMGQWDLYGKLPRPQNRLQKFVHLVDYLASRSKITISL